tara:strand:- start:193 stop:399 length:207 start_codon:yes stop_codon:yes gene_type:complete
MKIICTPQEYRDLNDVIVAGCCWIGSGEGKKLSNGKKDSKVDIEKFKMATSMIRDKKKVIEWEFIDDK